MRHAASVFNDEGTDLPDCGLSARGAAQARALTGHYDLVVVSPLKRARHTLELSRITFSESLTLGCAREVVTDLCDCLPGETFVPETPTSVAARIAELTRLLASWVDTRSVLVISHADLIWNLTAREIGGEQFGQWTDNCEKIELAPERL